MDSVIQQGRDPEWRLAFEDRLDEAARARVRSAVKNGECVDEPNRASIAAGLARRDSVGSCSWGLVLLPVQLGVAVFWVRLFVTGRLPAVFGWFWIAVLLMLIGGYGLVSPGFSPSLGGSSRFCSRRHQPAECTPIPTTPPPASPLRRSTGCARSRRPHQ
jgi:hypothetical protein